MQYNVNFSFKGAFISVSDAGFTLDVIEQLQRISPINVDHSRVTSPLAPATPREITALRSLAGALNFLGQGACPPAT
jgi:hypothetical protein